jgi:hypothetical protein
VSDRSRWPQTVEELIEAPLRVAGGDPPPWRPFELGTLQVASAWVFPRGVPVPERSAIRRGRLRSGCADGGSSSTPSCTDRLPVASRAFSDCGSGRCSARPSAACSDAWMCCSSTPPVVTIRAAPGSPCTRAPGSPCTRASPTARWPPSGHGPLGAAVQPLGPLRVALLHEPPGWRVDVDTARVVFPSCRAATAGARGSACRHCCSAVSGTRETCASSPSGRQGSSGADGRTAVPANVTPGPIPKRDLFVIKS